MLKKKTKTSLEYVLDHISLQQAIAEHMGVKIVSTTLENILNSVAKKSKEIYEMEIENARLAGRAEMLKEMLNK